jgi:hypothetical protein
MQIESQHGVVLTEGVNMDSIPDEIKDLVTKFHDPESDGFTKSDCRQKLIAIKNKTTEKAIRHYIDGLLKHG